MTSHKNQEYINTKTLKLADFELFTLRDELVVANCRERVYLEQQILA